MHSPHDITSSLVPLVAPLPAQPLHLAPTHRATHRRRRRLHIEGTTLLAITLFVIGLAAAAAVAWFTGAVYTY